MKVPLKTQYSVKVLVDLALDRRGASHTAGDMAVRLGIPRQFLQQILLALKAAGLVDSRRGLKGGYVLAHDPAKLTLAMVFQTTQGDLLASPETNGVAPKGVDAVLSDVWAAVRRRLGDELGGVTIADICGRVASLPGASDYAI